MDSRPFLSVDNQPIYLQQALHYLQLAGKLKPMIGDILRQYVLDGEMSSRPDLNVNPAVTQQAEIDFRLKNQLTEQQAFQEWLRQNGIDYQTFHNQVVFGFKLAMLKAQIADPKLQQYFIDRKLFLDRVILSRIIVNNPELAEEIHSQIEEGTSFEQLAREYSLADDRLVNGMMGPISRGTMPDKLRATIDSAKPGDLIGPIEVDGSWALFRVEQFLPASLEDARLREMLQNELFEQWLAEKLKTINVRLEVS